MRTSTADRLTEVLSEMIEEMIGEHDEHLDAEKVKEIVSEELNDFEVDADNVTGLEHAVENAVEREFDNRLRDAVQSEVDACLPDKLADARPHDAEATQRAVVAALNSPEGQRAVDNAVRQALMRLVAAFITGNVPIAPPV